MPIDPALYLQFGSLLLDLIGKIPKDGMSDDKRREFHNNLALARAVHNAMATNNPEEKTQAMHEIERATDEGNPT